MGGFTGGGGGSNPFGAEVDLTEMQQIAANTLVGNNTGGAAVPLALTATQARTLLALGTAALAATGDFDAAGAAAAVQALAALRANNLGDLASAATARGNLGLGTAAVEAASAFQAADAELAAIAGLASEADKGLYFTGSGAASLYDLTSYARTLAALSTKAAVQNELAIEGFAMTGTKTAAYTAVNRDWVLCDANGAAGNFAVTLPASPSNGDKVRVTLITDHATRKVTIDRNGSNVMGSTSTGTFDLCRESDTIDFCYVGGDTGWAVSTDIRTHRCLLRRDAAQSLADATETKIAVDAETFDYGEIGDIATNDRVDIRRHGVYLIVGRGGTASLTTGSTRRNSIRVNGSEVASSTVAVTALSGSAMYVAHCAELTAGDYVELWMYQDSAGAVDTSTSAGTLPTLFVQELR